MERESSDSSGRQIVHRFTCESTDSLRSPSRLVRLYSTPKDADEQRKIQAMYDEIEQRMAQGRSFLDDTDALSRPLNYNQPLQPELILSEQKEDRRSHQLTETRTHKSLQDQLERELFRETENPDGLRSSIKQHVIQRLTTLTPIQQDENAALKEKLLRWAQRSTEGYPRVVVTDLTNSWRDGLALNAILHRNRPELFDYHELLSRTSVECVEHALNAYERECLLPRTLHAEQVVQLQHVQDEKALFEYLYRIYQHFPNPPYRNPLEDEHKRQQIRQFELRAAALLQWIRDTTNDCSRRDDFGQSVHELKSQLDQLKRLRSGELNDRLVEKQRLIAMEKEAWKWAGQLGVKLDAQYSAENLDLLWTRMLRVIQQREDALLKALNEANRLEQLAQAVREECRRVDAALDVLKLRIDGEVSRLTSKSISLDRLALESFAIDEITEQIKALGDRIKRLFADCQQLRELQYVGAAELLREVQRLHERWSKLHRRYQVEVLQALAELRQAALRRPATEDELIAAHAEFRLLHECIRWVQQRLQQVKEAGYGEDAITVKIALEAHKSLQREVDAYSVNIATCERNAANFTDHALEIYEKLLQRLQQSYAELLVLCNQRTGWLEALLDLVQACADECTWADERADHELRRDWAAVATANASASLTQVDVQLQRLNSQLSSKRSVEEQLRKRGEELLTSGHPALQTIRAHLDLLEERFVWLKVLNQCSNTHLRHSKDGAEFRRRAQQLQQWFAQIRDKLENEFSVSNPPVELCEQLLSELTKLKNEIENKRNEINWLETEAPGLIPITARSRPLINNLPAISLVTITRSGHRLTAQAKYTLKDNHDLLAWVLTNESGEQLTMESALFSLQPPDNEALALVEQLRQKYSALIELWALQSHKLRVALITATLGVLQGWDYDTYISMQELEIAAILNALEEDIDKLAREGPADDPDTRRLQDELRALKRKFADFDERRRREQAANAFQARIDRFLNSGDDILQQLREKERELNVRCAAPIPTSLEALQTLSSEFSEFEFSVKRLETRVAQSRAQYTELGSPSGSAGQLQDTINELWSWLLKQLALYADRLRELRPALGAFEQSQRSLQQIESKFTGSASSNVEQLASVERLAADLRDAETATGQQQTQLTQLTQAIARASTAVIKTRRSDHPNADVQRLESDAKSIASRFEQFNLVLRGLGAKLQTFTNDARRADQDLTNFADDRALSPIHSVEIEALSEQLSALQRLEQTRLSEVSEQISRLQSLAESLNSSLRPLFEFSRIEHVANEMLQYVRRLQQKLADLRRNLSDRIRQAQSALEASQQLHDSQRALQELLQRLSDQLQPLESHIQLEPEALAEQLRSLGSIRAGLHEADRLLDAFKTAAVRLIELCGERVRAELRSAQDQLESQLAALRARLAKAEVQLNSALDLARDFAQLLQELLDQLEQWEEEASRLSQPAADLDSIRLQLQRLRALRDRVIGEQARLERFQLLSQRLLQLPADQSARTPIRESVQEVLGRHSALLELIAKCEQRLEAELQRLGQWSQLLQELLKWLSGAEQQLAAVKTEPADVAVLSEQLQRLQQLRQQVQAHQPSVDKLNSAAATGSFSNNDLAELNRRWTRLCDGLRDKLSRLQQLLNQAERLQTELTELLAWITQLDAQLGSSKPIGALPETARAQLDEFIAIYEQIEQQIGRVETALRSAEQALREAPEGSCRELRSAHQQLAGRWESLLSRANERKIKLELALQEAIELQEQLDQFENWLNVTNQALINAPQPSRLLDPLVEQLDEHKRLQDELPARREQMLALDRKCAQLRYFCDKRDAATLQQINAELAAGWERLVAACAARAAELDAAYKETREFFDLFDELSAWVDDALRAQAQLHPSGEESAARLQQLLQKQKDLQRLTASKQPTYERTQRLGSALQRAAPAHEQPEIRRLLDELKDRWQRLQMQALEQQRQLEEALLLAGQLREAIRALLAWADSELQRLDGERLYGDLETVQQLIERQRRFDAQLQAKQRSAKMIAESAEQLLASSQAEEAPLLQRQLVTVQQRLSQLVHLCEQRNATLADALKLAERLDHMIHELLDWLSGAEKRLRGQQPDAQQEDIAALQRAQAIHRAFELELLERKPLRDQCLELIVDLLRRCHPDAISPLNHWQTIVQSRWEEVASWSRRCAAKLTEQLVAAEKLQELAEQLSDWLTDAERTLNQRNAAEQTLAEQVPDSGDWQRLLTEHQLFIDQMSAKQPSVERVLRFGCRKSASNSGCSSPVTGLSGSATITRSSKRHGGTGSGLSLGKEPYEREWRSEQIRLLAEKWRQVWIFAMERLRSLQRRLDESGGNNSGDSLISLKMSDTNRSEHEVIMDEVQKQLAKCTCIGRFLVYHVGEGKYRFGDSAKLRLVRIVRNSVNVRVGGGFVSLEEFLAKNDPCRAKSRSSSLNESKSSDSSKYNSSLEGPSPSMIPYPKGVIITSSREKLYSSSGAAVKPERQSVRAKDPLNSDFSFTDDSGIKSRSRSRLTFTSPTGSIPMSRQSNRPPSRAGSELSLESIDLSRRTPTLTRKFTSATSISNLVRRN